MFNGPEKVRSLSENLDLGGNIYALKLKYKEIPPAFFLACTLDISLWWWLKVLGGVLSFSIPETIVQLSFICPHSCRTHQLKYFY